MNQENKEAGERMAAVQALQNAQNTLTRFLEIYGGAPIPQQAICSELGRRAALTYIQGIDRILGAKVETRELLMALTVVDSFMAVVLNLLQEIARNEAVRKASLN